jgi:hypothetical protein
MDVPVFPKLLFDDLVVCEWDALLVDFTVTALCDRISVGNLTGCNEYAL